MKTKVFFCAILTIVSVGVLCGSLLLSSKTQDAFLKANVEALAELESGQSYVCYKKIKDAESSKVIYCGTCTYIKGTYTWLSGTDNCVHY